MNNKTHSRIVSIDVFRGITIGFMILVNNPGSWEHIYSPLRHAKWHGCTPTDLVFPFFLFVMGLAMRTSFKKYDYSPSNMLIKKVYYRSIIIFLLGLLLNALPVFFQSSEVSSFRIMGVLQRISLGYLLSSIILLYINEKGTIYISGFILIIYWLLLLYGVNDNPYTIENNLVRKIDLAILGEKHIYTGNSIPFEPEGFLSTLTATVTIILGYLCGKLLHKDVINNIFPTRLIILGFLGILIGLIWGFIFPINKHLWTSSFVLYTAGIATICYALIYWLIEIKKCRKIGIPFIIFGGNSIFIYVASSLLSTVFYLITINYNGDTISLYSYIYKIFFTPIAGDLNGSLLFALSQVLFFWLILLLMHKKGIRIKI